MCIATFGAENWSHLARTRALPSVQHTDVVVEHQPDGTLASARNAAAERASGEWLVFLDGDDALAPGYVDAMRRAIPPAVGKALLVPRVQYVGKTGHPRAQPFFYPEVDHTRGNWMVIGTMLPRAAFMEVGGFDDRWPIYEDWAVFARLVEAGCVPVKVPDAVYLATRTPGSRNHSKSRHARVYYHQAIGHSIWPDLYDKTTPDEDARETLLRPDGRPAGVLRFLR